MSLQIGYLEIVTPEVDATCATYAAQHGVAFSEPVAMLGGARIATLADGRMLGVRGPMRPDEAPIVRPYWLVDDIEAAVATGAEVAMGATQLPGVGTFAITIQGGVNHGLWQR